MGCPLVNDILGEGYGMEKQYSYSQVYVKLIIALSVLGIIYFFDHNLTYKITSKKGLAPNRYNSIYCDYRNETNYHVKLKM